MSKAMVKTRVSMDQGLLCSLARFAYQSVTPWGAVLGEMVRGTKGHVRTGIFPEPLR